MCWCLGSSWRSGRQVKRKEKPLIKKSLFFLKKKSRCNSSLLVSHTFIPFTAKKMRKWHDSLKLGHFIFHWAPVLFTSLFNHFFITLIPARCASNSHPPVVSLGSVSGSPSPSLNAVITVLRVWWRLSRRESQTDDSQSDTGSPWLAWD